MNQGGFEIRIELDDASKIVKELYNLEGDLIPLDGEIDFNFKLQTKENNFLLKTSRLNPDSKNVEFQTELLSFISANSYDIIFPELIPNNKGNKISLITSPKGELCLVSLLTWVDGRIYSQINPKNDDLLYSLGKEAGKITKILQNFDHPFAHRYFEWDIAHVEWTKDYINLFNDDQQNIINYFLDLFSSKKDKYNKFRKAIVHNDVNDNNIIVPKDLIKLSVISIIYYGDSIYTQFVNDAAICIA